MAIDTISPNVPGLDTQIIRQPQQTLDAYFGAVATRIMPPTFRNATATTYNGNSLHVAQDDISIIQVAYANWYTESVTHEAGSGNACTFQAQIQYPIGGPWQSFAWGRAATSPSVASGDTSPLTDPLPLSTKIPRGAAFLMHQYQVSEAPGLVIRYSNTNDQRTAFDQAQAGVGVANTTVVASPAAGALFAPVRIVGLTRRPSLFFFGDSRMWGQGNSISDGSGDFGEAAQSLGSSFAYGNFAVPGEQLQYWLTNNSRRLALLADYTHVIGNPGINDLRTGGRTPAQVLADIATAAAQFGNRPVFWHTIMTSATSTDAYTTIANQTVGGENASRIAVNRALRGGQVAGLAGVFDTAGVVESSPESGKFAIGNGGQPIVIDSLHLGPLGYAMIKAAKVINPALITRRTAA